MLTATARRIKEKERALQRASMLRADLKTYASLRRSNPSERKSDAVDRGSTRCTFSIKKQHNPNGIKKPCRNDQQRQNFHRRRSRVLSPAMELQRSD